MELGRDYFGLKAFRRIDMFLNIAEDLYSVIILVYLIFYADARDISGHYGDQRIDQLLDDLPAKILVVEVFLDKGVGKRGDERFVGRALQNASGEVIVALEDVFQLRNPVTEIPVAAFYLLGFDVNIGKTNKQERSSGGHFKGMGVLRQKKEESSFVIGEFASADPVQSGSIDDVSQFEESIPMRADRALIELHVFNFIWFEQIVNKHTSKFTNKTLNCTTKTYHFRRILSHYSQTIKSLSMKAIVLKAPGGVENLVLEEVKIPAVNAHEVLVKVKAIGLNPVEATLRNNEAFLKMVLRLKAEEAPVILGWDISGIVERVGRAVTGFRKGDEVFGAVNFPGHGKAYAEYVAASEAHLALKPDSISHKEAAASPIAALTAWQSLMHIAGVKAGDKVLVHAASGGVGHYIVQIAKHFGAHVIGTSSAANRDFVLSLGADEHIDYSIDRFEDRVKDADIVIDSLDMPGHLERSIKAVKPRGKVISLVAFPDERLSRIALMKQVFLYRMEVASNAGDMRALAGLFEKGHLRSHVSMSFSLDGIAEAHQYLENGHTTGKIVVTV